MSELPALLDQVLLELEASTDPERLALLHRIRQGTQTAQDASVVADLIESLVEHGPKAGRNN